MASLMNKLQTFARSPQGKKLLTQARGYASKPENQAKLKSLGSRFTSKGKRR
jgi:hypothetical protein